jgi:hypothetical protein
MLHYLKGLCGLGLVRAAGELQAGKELELEAGLRTRPGVACSDVRLAAGALLPGLRTVVLGKEKPRSAKGGAR